MTITFLAGSLLLTQLGLLAAILYLRYLSNKGLFKSEQALTPVRSKNPLFRGFSGLFDWLDRSPLRRSGNANEFDLLKAMTLVTVPVFLLELLLHRPSVLVALMAANVLMLLINVIMLAHPVTKRLVGRK